MNSKKSRVLAIPYILWIIGFTVIPLLFVFAKAVTNPAGGFTFDNLLAIFDPVHRKSLLLSILLAFAETMSIVPYRRLYDKPRHA